MRLMRRGVTARQSEARPSRRIYDEAVAQGAGRALEGIGPRPLRHCLKTLIPTLVEAMERHRHLRPGPEIRAARLVVSAAMIDTALRELRERAGGKSRRQTLPLLPRDPNDYIAFA